MNEWMRDCLQFFWSRRSITLLGKREMLLLDAYKGHLATDARSVIHAIIPLGSIPRGFTS
jgi:hypothetical protein